jgi:hypothetical protein
MSSPLRLLIKTVVKPYYRQNAGLFLFAFLILIGVMGRLKGRGWIVSHYLLMLGFLGDAGFLLFVLFIWLLYAMKCAGFMTELLQRPEYSFLNMLLRLDKNKSYGLLLFVQVFLFLPVLLYVFAAVGVSVYQHWYITAAVVLLYNVTVCLVSAWWYRHYLQHPGKRIPALQQWISGKLQQGRTYAGFLLQYLFNRHKLLLFSIKLYNCGTLYLMARNLTDTYYDVRMLFLFYSFGIFAHGVLIHKLRGMEETGLFFYRGLPVSLFNRFMQYVLVYFLLLLPEFITILWITPGYLHVKDALVFGALGFSILLFLHSLLFTTAYSMKDYLKVCFGIFCTVYFCVLAGIMAWLAVVLFCLAIVLFLVRYYRYEQE